MSELTIRGRFVWHDLLTPDADAAIAFYEKVIGWRAHPSKADARYPTWLAPSGKTVGGVIQAAAEISPHWRTYIGSTDIEGTVRDAVRLGGSVSVPVTALADGGSYAMLKDPQGHSFGVRWAADAVIPTGTSQPGGLVWHELATTDHSKLFTFYETLFGWQKAGEHSMGELGTYLTFGIPNQPLGGMYNSEQDTTLGWCSFAVVSDARALAESVPEAGGSLFKGPMQVEGGGWIVQFRDPQGALHAAVSYAR